MSIPGTKSTNKVLLVAAVTFGLGFAASAYLNYFQAQQNASNQAQLQGQITDLTYQVNLDRKNGTAATPTATPSPKAATPTPTATPTPAATQTMTITEMGVSLTAVAPVSDLAYVNDTAHGVLKVADLFSPSLKAANPACGAGSLGQITQRPKGSAPSAADQVIKAIGNYTYYYVPVGECAATEAGKALRASMVSTLQSTILPTLN